MIKQTTGPDTFKIVLQELGSFHARATSSPRELRTDPSMQPMLRISMISTGEKGLRVEEFSHQTSIEDDYPKLREIENFLLRNDVIGGKIVWGNGFVGSDAREQIFFIPENIRPREHREVLSRNVRLIDDESFMKLFIQPYLLFELLLKNAEEGESNAR